MIMRNTDVTPRTIFIGLRFLIAAGTLGLMLALGFAQPASGQVVNGLTPAQNYFVTGDYVVGGWVIQGASNGSDLATGTITIPDPKQPNSTSVPVGADIVAAFLYWETVESTSQLPPHPGQTGTFNGFAITGKILGNQNAPTSWSNGGCGGSNGGTKTIVAYRADVRPFLPVDPTNGRIQGNLPNQGNQETFSLPVSLVGGGNGNGTPFTLGASLVIIYRVQASPLVYPLNAIVLYDGAVAPSNQTSTNVEMAQTIQGFYQPDGLHRAKITHIVGDGQPNKGETALLNGSTLPLLYPTLSTTAAFPGVYNGSWDNVTWDVTSLMNAATVLVPLGSAVTTSVMTPPSGGGCVDWGAIIFSTTVQSSDGDGLLDVWKTNQGYTDLLTGQAVALPGAKNGQKDLFVQIDYLSNLDGGVPSYPKHSHLPKQSALDMVGDALAAPPPNIQPIHIHFDVGSAYQNGDPYIIQGGTGGNKISESTVLCTDSTSLCQFPGQVAVGWKEGFLFFRNQPLNYPDELSCETQTPPGGTAGTGPACIRRFQPGGKDSRHYVLFGHALGSPRTFWTTFASAVSNTSFSKLISIVNTGTTATVTIMTPRGLAKPGDCNPANLPPACTDANGSRVTVTGAIGQLALNGAYIFSNLVNSSPDANGVTTTTFNIATTNTTATCTLAPCVADGTYNLSNQQQLAVAYGGPTSSSGHSDLGGGDSMVTFGLWPVDDAPGCQADPSLALAPLQSYCTNEVGSITAQAGTLLHEMGHTFLLTHGGTYFPNGTDNLGQKTNNPPDVPSYGLNCSPGFLSSMNYLHQIRGFPDGGIGYSRQTIQDLSEKSLDEGLGIGTDMFTHNVADHFTRWYGPPSAIDLQLGRVATRHCDGTPILDKAQMTRVDGTTFSSPIDWDNDLATLETDTGIIQDVNFNGIVGDAPLAGFNDWANLDLRQTSARANTFGFSGGNSFDTVGGNSFDTIGGNSFDTVGGNAFDTIGGNSLDTVGGNALDTVGGNALDTVGGNEQDAETACSTADPPTGVMAVEPPKAHFVVVSWMPPGVCQVSRNKGYTIWRALGTFTTLTPADRTQFTPIGTANAPSTMFTDNNVMNGKTYTYFVTDTNTQGATSGASNPLVTVTVSF
jgi:hypothetical protein